MGLKTRTISEEIHKGRQDVNFTEVLVLNHNDRSGGAEHKLKISICSDSYKEQCHARVSRWDGTQWQLLHKIRSMATKPELAYVPATTTSDDFKADRKELLRVAEQILDF